MITELQDLLDPEVYRQVANATIHSLKSLITDPSDGSVIVASGHASAMIAFLVSAETKVPIMYVRRPDDQNHHGCRVEGDYSSPLDVARMIFVGYKEIADDIVSAIQEIRSYYHGATLASVPRIVACITGAAIDLTSVDAENDAPVVHLIAGESAAQKLPTSRVPIIEEEVYAPTHALLMYTMNKSTDAIRRVAHNIRHLISTIGATGIAVCGKSGIALAGYMIYHLHLPVFVVFKDHDTPISTSGARGHRLLFVDDLVDTGHTLSRVMSIAEEWTSQVISIGTYSSYMYAEQFTREMFDVCRLPNATITKSIPHYEI